MLNFFVDIFSTLFVHFYFIIVDWMKVDLSSIQGSMHCSTILQENTFEELSYIVFLFSHSIKMEQLHLQFLFFFFLS